MAKRKAKTRAQRMREYTRPVATIETFKRDHATGDLLPQRDYGVTRLEGMVQAIASGVAELVVAGEEDAWARRVVDLAEVLLNEVQDRLEEEPGE